MPRPPDHNDPAPQSRELTARAAELARFREQYRNPLIKAGFTFIEVFPIGLVVTLVSAAILRRPGAASP